jgi:hypothetical protein
VVATPPIAVLGPVANYCYFGTMYLYNVGPLWIMPNMPLHQAFFIGAMDDIKTINEHE